MISGIPIWTVLLIGCGVFCASFVDAIGGGGGIISVPVYLLAGLPTHFALGTNKLSSGIGTAASTFRYLKNGYVDWMLAIPSVVFALVGAHLGTKLQIAIDERYLKYLLLIFCNFAKMDLRTASGNVKVVNLSSNIGALFTSLMAGKVLVPVGLIVAVFSIAGHYIGAGLTIKNGAKIVRPVILIVLVLLAIKVVTELI